MKMKKMKDNQNIIYKGALREKKGGFLKPRYYFGEPYYDIYTKHWDYAIEGNISFQGATLIFKAKDFTPNQPQRNQLLNSYFYNRNSRGILLLKLNLKKLKNIKKFLSSRASYNLIWLRFEVHDAFLSDDINDLNFTIRANSKDAIKKMYNKIISAKSEEYFESETGSLKFIVDNNVNE